jgi:phage gp36-like protein
MGLYSTNTSWLPENASATSHVILQLTSSDVNTQTVDSIIDRRERMVEAYLGRRYKAPFTTSAILTKIVEDMVTYDIYSILYNHDSALVNQENLQSNYDLATGMLSDLASGQAILIDDSGELVPERNVTNKIYSNVRDYEPTFDVGNYLNWKVSIGRQDDLNDARDLDI